MYLPLNQSLPNPTNQADFAEMAAIVVAGHTAISAELLPLHIPDLEDMHRFVPVRDGLFLIVFV